MAFGDRAATTSTMLINIDLTSVGNWAERNNVSYASYQELAGHPQVYDMIAQARGRGEPRAAAEEPQMAASQIKRFLILHKELDADDGELTRTQKVRRRFIAERYAPLIKALYDGSKEADISTEVTFEDGRKGMIEGDVRTSSTCRPIRARRQPDAGGGRMKADVEPSRDPSAAPSPPATCCCRSRTCRCRSAA